MAAKMISSSRDVQTENLYMRRRERPESPGSSMEEVAENQLVTFVDARTTSGGLESWDLDTHGFCCRTPPPAVDFLDRELTSATYGPELIEQAKKLTGAKEGYFYQMLTRPTLDGAVMPFSTYTHADFGANAVPMFRQELVSRFGVAEEEAANCDLCLLNVWIPWGNPAFKDPLGLLDASTVRYEDEVVPIPFANLNLFYPGGRDRSGNVMARKSAKEKAYSQEIREKFGTKSKESSSSGSAGSAVKAAVQSLLVGPAYSPKHRWVFCSDQKPNEAWFFKQWDTRPNVAKSVFHNSFIDPFHASDPNCPTRRSVELRLLLTFPRRDDEDLESKKKAAAKL